MQAKHLERLVRGFSHSRRIRLLQTLEQEPGSSLKYLAFSLKLTTVNAEEHLRRLWIAGLIEKERRGRLVCHSLTDAGRQVITFLRKW